MKTFKNTAFAKANTQQTASYLLTLAFLMISFMTTAQSWTGTWQSTLGEMKLEEQSGQLSSKFSMKRNNRSETAILYASINGDVATGTIKYNGNKIYYLRWKLINNNKIEGVYAASQSLLDSSDNMDFTATRKSNPLYQAQDVSQVRKAQVAKKPRTVRLNEPVGVQLSPDKQARIDNFNRGRVGTSTGSSSRKKPVERRVTNNTPKPVDAAQTYKITVEKMYIYEKDASKENRTHEIYGTIGIRARKISGSSTISLPDVQKRPARVWSYSSSKHANLRGAGGNNRSLVQPIGNSIAQPDPTGLTFISQGHLNINKSRTFKIKDSEIKSGAQVNIQMKLAEADPGYDDDFPWKQRTLSIKDMVLGKSYLLIQREKKDKDYKVAITFKVEQI